MLTAHPCGVPAGNGGAADPGSGAPAWGHDLSQGRRSGQAGAVAASAAFACGVPVSARFRTPKMIR
ncbi:hypothetical protein Vlu01_29760 [Micromonospora lutea]|uniref:Uncharacterized protein n=1 Tax=Micromonospora lutea TaxID=419825 RepID=A0ABQ4IWW2_9ACTN|nr:hypothetical protein Vlu01_29760 [Micromonospora lutea]